MMATACRVTGESPSAISVIEISGHDASAWIDRNWSPANGQKETKINSIRYGNLSIDTDVWESIIVCRTAQDRFELHCHGGKLAAQNILSMMANDGITVETQKHWCTENNQDPFIAQATLALVDAKTVRTARILLDQQRGASVCALKQIDSAILQGDLTLAKRLADDLRAWNELGLHLTEPYEILLCGPPNVGKSSLLNRLLGYQRAIVHEQAGTTRDLLSEDSSIDGWPVRIKDSAGLRTASDTIEQAGVERAIRASRSADLQLLLVDPSQGWTNEHQQLLDLNPTKSIIVETKSDLQMTNSHHRGEFKAVQNPHARVSSITGDGIRELLEAISMRLVPQIPPSGQGVLINPIQQQALEDRFGDQVTFR
jgi:tRNA modification GTPase